RFVATTETTISPMAPSRSAQGARLKNSHQTRTASAHASPPITAPIRASCATAGTPNQSSHCSATATTPGHSRSGFRDVNSSVCTVFMSDHTFRSIKRWHLRHHFILFVLRRPDGFFRLMLGRPVAVKSCAKRCQHFSHISDQIIFHFRLVNNKNLAALRRQSGFEVFKAKLDQSISMLNHDNPNGLTPKKL